MSGGPRQRSVTESLDSECLFGSDDAIVGAQGGTMDGVMDDAQDDPRRPPPPPPPPPDGVMDGAQDGVIDDAMDDVMDLVTDGAQDDAMDNTPTVVWGAADEDGVDGEIERGGWRFRVRGYHWLEPSIGESSLIGSCQRAFEVFYGLKEPHLDSDGLSYGLSSDAASDKEEQMDITYGSPGLTASCP